MEIFVVGSGKLASEILDSGMSFPSGSLKKWEEKPETYSLKSVIVHAGSGRQLDKCIGFCKRSKSVFIELSTGLETETMQVDFTLILCPNTSILMLKTMSLLEHFGQYFAGNNITITESHQAAKQSVPGTAFNLAKSFQVPSEKIISIRDTDFQQNELKIPDEFLDRHAYHKITIQDGSDEVSIETRVLGHQSYSKGVKKIIDAILVHQLEERKYSVLEFIENKWL